MAACGHYITNSARYQTDRPRAYYEKRRDFMHPTPSCPLPDVRAARIDPIRPADTYIRLFADRSRNSHAGLCRADVFFGQSDVFRA